MSLRDHKPLVLEEFNGWWKRGDQDSCPVDHFPDCENIQYIESGFRTRDGLDTLIAKGNVVRMFNYKMQTGESFIELDTDGNFWHSLLDGSEITYGPILSIPDATDFKLYYTNGFAYITPFKTYTDDNGKHYQKGLENEFVYVYKGDGTAARKAAGFPPTSSETTPLLAYNSPIEGVVTPGIHVIAITFSDGMGGDSTGLGTTVKPVIYQQSSVQIIVANLQIPSDPGLTERKIWMTKAIDPADWNPDTTTYTFYLAKTVTNITDINTIIDIADADLITAFVAGVLPNPTSGGIVAENSEDDGFCDLGLHVIGVVYETDTGYLTAPGPEILAIQTFVNEKKAIDISNIPVSPDSFVTKRHLVASKKIEQYNGDDLGYQLYFIPDGTIEDNTTTTKTVSFFDIDLLEDASHLIDNFAEIPSGAVLTSFNGRLVLAATFTDPSLAYLSAPGEPEAIDQVDGQVIMPLDGNPITNAQEFRDVLYLFKQTRTSAVNDNGDVPSTWSVFPIDQGLGASVHGICLVLDSGGVNIDFILIVDYSGILIFNGTYGRPGGELTWKIQDFWYELDRNAFDNIQIVNETVSQIIYMTLPNKKMLMGDYRNGFTPKDIRWAPWRFDIETNTIALFNTNQLAIGATQEAM